MNQNSLIEVGSKANVIISFNAVTTINGSTYAIGEPYLFLKDVLVEARYKEDSKIGSSGAIKVATNLIYPDTIVIQGANFSSKLASLLLCYKSTSTFGKRTFITLPADTGKIYLTEDIFSSSDIYAYDSSFNQISFTYSSIDNSINSANFIKDTEYLISFSSVIAGTRFNLIQPSIPYLTLQIQSIGNINKTSKEVIMYFDKVSLNSAVDFSFISNDKINIPLSFKILDTISYVIFED